MLMVCEDKSLHSLKQFKTKVDTDVSRSHDIQGNVIRQMSNPYVGCGGMLITLCF